MLVIQSPEWYITYEDESTRLKSSAPIVPSNTEVGPGTEDIIKNLNQELERENYEWNERSDALYALIKSSEDNDDP